MTLAQFDKWKLWLAKQAGFSVVQDQNGRYIGFLPKGKANDPLHEILKLKGRMGTQFGPEEAGALAKRLLPLIGPAPGWRCDEERMTCELIVLLLECCHNGNRLDLSPECGAV
jgi:hypothetical protein